MEVTYGELPVDRDGAGYEDTGDHIEGDWEENKLASGSRDHRHKCKTDEEDQTAVRGVWLRRSLRPATGKPSPKRVELETVEKVLSLYQEKYYDFNVQHFHEKLVEEHG